MDNTTSAKPMINNYAERPMDYGVIYVYIYIYYFLSVFIKRSFSTTLFSNTCTLLCVREMIVFDV